MKFLKITVIVANLYIFWSNTTITCPTSLGKNLLDTNQISYKDLSKQAGSYE